MRNLKSLALIAAGTTALTLTAGRPAHALQLFNFSYSAGSISANGTLTTTDFDPIANNYTITGITGTRNGVNIAALLPPGTYPTFLPPPNDNLLTATLEPTYSGFSFQDANGLNVNVFNGFSAGFFENAGNSFDANFTQTRVNLSITPVPIPTPALLPGLIGLGAAALRKRKQEKVEAKV
jgi:hypothetical protein